MITIAGREGIHPQTLMCDELQRQGWQRILCSEPETYTYPSGTAFLTWKLGAVRVATSGSQSLWFNGTRVECFIGNYDDVCLDAISVDEDSRQKGKATEAMQMFCAIADRAGISLWLQPEPLEDKPLSRPALTRWYQSFGFTPQDETTDRVLIRRPAGWAS